MVSTCIDNGKLCDLYHALWKSQYNYHIIRLINKMNNKKEAKIFGTLLDGEWIKSKELMSF